MNRAAVILADGVIYWNGVVLLLAAGAAVCLFLSAYLAGGGSSAGAAVAGPVALECSLVLSRLLHWYFMPDSYPGFLEAMTDYTRGDYALPGVFLGCLLAAGLTRLLRLETHIFRLLDAMSLGLCGGIAAGRLSFLFGSADRGPAAEGFAPFVLPVVNEVSGNPEYRLATFVLQSVAAGLLCLILWGVFLFGKPRRRRITLLFLLFYPAGQVVLDSTRYDSLYLRSNGFLRFSQLASAVTLAAAGVYSAVSMAKRRGFRFWQLPLWLSMAALLAAAGYMEYVVQRRGGGWEAYLIMTACVVLFSLLSLWQSPG